MPENRWIVIQAKTIDEALTRGSMLLHADRDRIEYEILEEAHTNRHGRLLRPYKVRLTIAERPSSGAANLVAGDASEEPTFEISAEALEAMDIASFLALVEQIKRRHGSKTLPKEKPSAAIFDGRVYVEVSADRMEAYLMMTPPNGGAQIALNEVKEALAEAHVTYGIRWDVIEEMVRSQQTYRRILIATGLPPKSGEDARLEFPQPIREGLRNGGDLKSYQSMVVEQEQVVARKIPMVPGVTGMTVTGESLSAHDGKDFSLYAKKGRNLRVSQDGSELIATTSGLVVMDGEKVSVESGLEIEGDITPETGHIDFVGDILVKGHIRRGVAIKSRGSVVVQGNVDSAIVEAAHHITVEGGILGRGTGSIRAGRTVTCKYVQQARIEAGEDIIIHDYCIHSDIRAGRRALVGGTIVGGMTYAAQTIRTKIAGSETGSATILVAGSNFQVREALEKLRAKIQHCREERESLEIESAKLLESEHQGKKLPVQKRYQLLESIDRIRRLTDRILSLEVERDGLLQNLDRERAAKISITSRAYPKVKIFIDEAALEIKEETQFATFSKDWDNSEIRMTSYY